MDRQYHTRIAEAYVRGHCLRHGLPLSDDLIAYGQERGLKMHYFKVKEDLPRVQAVLGFLHGIQFDSLLDVGSGRGVFMQPLLRDFPDKEITSIDILPHRVELWEDVAAGGIENLHPKLESICETTLPDKCVDVVTVLEVLEHIPDAEAAARQALRLARQYVLVTVPSKPDDNPEHIHLFSNDDLAHLFAGAKWVKFGGVLNHRFAMIAL